MKRRNKALCVNVQEIVMPQYFGILNGAGTVWGVRVPDLPGCHGGGESPNAALADAISAAREWAEHRTAKGLNLPAPRALEDILREEVKANQCW